MSEYHDEWCDKNGCRCGKCECAQMPDCPKPKPWAHPDTMIGRAR
jgi:hypothetical protein